MSQLIKKPTSSCDCIKKLFEIRDQSHYIHLQTTSYAQHKAMNQFYDSILDLTDTFVEVYQGKYGRIKGGFSLSIATDMDANSYIKSIRAYFEKTGELRRGFDMNDTHLHNIVDEMLSLVDKTIYLLTLK